MRPPYDGRHADLYDLFYAEKPYADQAGWISRTVPSAAAVLDLACGTGGHSLALLSLGHPVVGIDLSPDMVRRAKQKAREVGVELPVCVGDMRESPVAADSFDAVVCLFDSIGYARTDEGILSTLDGIRRALKAGGTFVLEFWHKPTMVASFDPVRVRRWPTPEGQIVRISETDLVIEESLARVTYSVLELRDNGSYSAFEETHINRYFTVDEMESFLTRTGFSQPRWTDGFSTDAVSSETWHVVGVAVSP